MKCLLIPVLALCILGCDEMTVENADDSARVEYLKMPGTEDLGLPFSAAVRVDNLLFLSGNIGNIPGSMTLADGGIQGETRQTLENIKNVLETFGSSMDKVFKCTVFLADISEWGAMNEVYKTYFENPAWSWLRCRFPGGLRAQYHRPGSTRIRTTVRKVSESGTCLHARF